MHTRNRPFSRPPECMHVKSKCAEWWWSGTNGAQRYEVHGQAQKEPGGSERAEDGNKTFDTKQLRLAVMQQQRRYRSCGAVETAPHELCRPRLDSRGPMPAKPPASSVRCRRRPWLCHADRKPVISRPEAWSTHRRGYNGNQPARRRPSPKCFGDPRSTRLRVHPEVDFQYHLSEIFQFTGARICIYDNLRN